MNVSPSLPIDPPIIYSTPSKAPTSTAHSDEVHPDCCNPCSSIISSIIALSTTITAPVPTTEVLKRSVSVCASKVDIPLASKSIIATVLDLGMTSSSNEISSMSLSKIISPDLRVFINSAGGSTSDSRYAIYCISLIKASSSPS